MLAPALLALVSAVSYEPNDLSAYRSATDLVVQGMLDYYPPASASESKRLGATIGTFQAPYYWWEAGVAWGVLIDWETMVGESNYTTLLKDALTTQAGTAGDFMPQNQSLTEGNDDQGFWGLAAMTAAERNFSNPDNTQRGWLYNAQAVYNDMKSRWETSKCGGGLRWQIYTWNSGYDYKNSVSNGCFFALAARLARYTGNSMYADMAEEIFDWLLSVKYIDTSTSSYPVYDGAGMSDNCTTLTKYQWSYNSGLMLSGSAYMYDYTNGSSKWGDRAKGLWSQGSTQFFKNDIVYESACQPSGRCNTDQRVFKGIYLQQLGQTAVLVPDLQSSIMGAINSSAAAAAASCSGGSDGHTCGLDWTNKNYDGVYGVGEQISALSAFSQALVLNHKPLTANTGGTSNGSVDAGTSASNSTTNQSPFEDNKPVTTGARAGAGVVTAVLMVFLIAVGVWIIL